MRDPRRIPAITHALRRTWELVPDMRLGQLVIAVAVVNNFQAEDLFGIEDEQWVLAIDRFYMSLVNAEANTLNGAQNENDEG